VITPASAAQGKYLQRRLKWNTCNGKRNYIGAVGGKHQQRREKIASVIAAVLSF
jgi:hypothetical protein